jgi:anaphase-promoting complex subunit 3
VYFLIGKVHKRLGNTHLEKHTLALSELEQLKQIVPKESLVYFLIGKVHKRLGNTHLALMNFSWAMDLDPKGANNQIKEVIDRQYSGDDDEVVVCLDTSEEPGASANSSAAASSMRRRSQQVQFADAMDQDNDADDDDESFDNEVSEGNLEVSI